MRENSRSFFKGILHFLLMKLLKDDKQVKNAIKIIDALSKAGGMLIVLFVVCYMIIMGVNIPPSLENILMIIMGFFFGKKFGQEENG